MCVHPSNIVLMPEKTLNRREMIASLASLAALPLVAGCGGYSVPAPATPTTPNETTARALLNEVAENLIRLTPEGATSLGNDTGARAALRSLLTDRSAEGQRRIANQLRSDLARVNAFDASGLSHATRTTFDVVRSAYGTALEGFALPYGEVAAGGS